MDFLLWQSLIQLMYSPPANNVEELRERVETDIQTIQNDAGIFNV